MSEQYCVVYWEYGYHCDEFDLIEVVGPMTYEEAENTIYGKMDKKDWMTVPKNTSIVPFKTFSK